MEIDSFQWKLLGFRVTLKIPYFRYTLSCHFAMNENISFSKKRRRRKRNSTWDLWEHVWIQISTWVLQVIAIYSIAMSVFFFFSSDTNHKHGTCLFKLSKKKERKKIQGNKKKMQGNKNSLCNGFCFTNLRSRCFDGKILVMQCPSTWG